MKLKIFALSRSGHHAITYWLASNFVSKPSITVLARGQRHELEKGGEDILELYENERIPETDEPSIIILRDPYNNYASFSKFLNNPNYGPLSFFPILEYWTDYAKEVSGETNNLKNKYVILYNGWVDSEDYRKKVVKEIGEKFGVKLSFNDAEKNHMTPFGGGSSFDGLDFVRSANEMKVNKRYQNYESSISYRSRVDTPEMKILSEKIFGFYPWKRVEKPKSPSGNKVLEDFFS